MWHAGQFRQRVLDEFHVPEAKPAHQQRRRQPAIDIELPREAGEILLPRRLLDNIHGGAFARAQGQIDGDLRAFVFLLGQLFERFFPGREDVVRLLMEPITYANGSTLEDPAITYGIVFSNFMSQGVYTFQGGTDRLIGLMRAELERSKSRLRVSGTINPGSGQRIRISCPVPESVM